MVGILHMAGSCGSKKPNPANIQGTKINTQYINKLGTVAQQTQWLTTTQHTQDISKKSNPGNTQGTKINTQYINKLGTISQQTPPPTDAQNTQNTSKKFKPANTQYINKLDLDEQRTSSPEGKEFQKKTEIVTNPILEEIPKERQQQTPKILKNIVETVIATAKHAIIELGVTSLSTTQQINEINFVQEFHSGIDKAVEAISKVYVPIYPRLDSEKSVNGKYLAN
ncbi:hypothetical protein, partial [Cardinium endosymbiont of Culicoides punctatus]|uniref:hypothetical protein n=1 Tax=Cardinium endosymbiont of Culicoides punctatus TaxID=2304601 RepID=UPI001058C175